MAYKTVVHHKKKGSPARSMYGIALAPDFAGESVSCPIELHLYRYDSEGKQVKGTIYETVAVGNTSQRVEKKNQHLFDSFSKIYTFQRAYKDRETKRFQEGPRWIDLPDVVAEALGADYNDVLVIKQFAMDDDHTLEAWHRAEALDVEPNENLPAHNALEEAYNPLEPSTPRAAAVPKDKPKPNVRVPIGEKVSDGHGRRRRVVDKKSVEGPAGMKELAEEPAEA